jgi:nucleoside transporter
MDISVPLSTYIPVSLVMFLEYAVWGAWAPVLAARLLGPLKMSGKQTGWIYATLPLGCIVAPLVSGQLADRWLNAEWILAAAHLAGAVLLLVAAKQGSFRGLLPVMFVYSFCYAATLPLVNSVLFHYVKDGDTQGKVFIWAPIAWALVGWGLTGWRMSRKTEGDGSDCLVLAAILSGLMAVVCLLLPATPPANAGGMPIVEAFSLLRQPDFFAFMLISLVVAGTMQFYFLGSARFLTDAGLPGSKIPATMAIAQAAQAVATFFALGYCMKTLGFQQTLIIGALCWLTLYAVYVAGRPRWLLVAGQSLHGLAYVFFIIAGQVYASKVGPEIQGSTQALVFAATTGVGLFLGTQLAGLSMDRYSTAGQFQWSKIWNVPLMIVVIGVIALIMRFHGTLPTTP